MKYYGLSIRYITVAYIWPTVTNLLFHKYLERINHCHCATHKKRGKTDLETVIETNKKRKIDGGKNLFLI